MFIKQISIFVENRGGAIMEVTAALKAANINIRALCIADTQDFGIVRLIVDKTEAAIKALRAQDMTVVETDVLALSVEDTPGAFHVALEALYEGAVMIEYCYAFVAPVGGGATIILRCREQEAAAKLLTERGLKLLSQEEVSC
ncbi:MAG TPA: hypothetical protein GXZ52_05305 [Clostridiales bacterium]|jgi:hypothetical protein|nr:hypothetical protein [Clostridiales bacterium]